MLYKKNKPKRKVLKNPPLTSEEQLKEIITARNALNKQRAKSMERRIAKVLRGRRVPMSGAMAKYKGDVEIPFVNNPGMYIIECKLSAHVDNGKRKLRISFDWLTKIRDEAKAMGAKFGVLIIHYHNTDTDYVFIHHNVITMIISRYESVFNRAMQRLVETAPKVDIRFTKGGKALAAYQLEKDTIDNNLIDVEGLKAMTVIVPDGQYLVMPIDSFNTFVYHL